MYGCTSRRWGKIRISFNITIAYSPFSSDAKYDGLFKNNLPYVIILNIDKALRRWRLGTAIYQKNDS